MKNFGILVLLSGFLFGLADQADAAYEARLMVNNVQTRAVEAGKPMDWRIEIFDTATGTKVTKFQSYHGKKMHLVILSEDYSTYAHVHPKLLGVSGDFFIGMNQPEDDPDSLGTETALTKPGNYHVIVEIFPDVGSRIPVPVFLSIPLAVSGEVKLEPLVMNNFDAECFITRYTGDGHSSPYRIRLRPAVVNGNGGNLLKLHFQVDEWDQKTQGYFPAQDLQPLMRMEGHMFAARLEPGTRALKGFSHLHGMIHRGHPGMLMFNFFDRGEFLPDSGEVPTRLWMQFKHRNQVQVADFTLAFHKHIHHMCSGGHRH